MNFDEIMRAKDKLTKAQNEYQDALSSFIRACATSTETNTGRIRAIAKAKAQAQSQLQNLKG